MRFSIFKNNQIIPLLGRWNLKYDEKIINRIVSLANEDHCGCCDVKVSEDNYYLPFCM